MKSLISSLGGVFLGSAILAATVAQPSLAQDINVPSDVFNGDNRPVLCPARAQEVTPEALAPVLFGYIDNQFTVLENLGPGSNRIRAMRFFARDAPFETPIDQVGSDRTREILKQSIARKDLIVNELASFIGTRGGRPKFGYHLDRDVSELPPRFVPIFFAGGDSFRIECKPVSAGEAAAAEGAELEPSPYRVRGRVDQLAADPGTDAFRAASSAAVSFVRNNELDSDAIEINGVVGYVFREASDNAIEQAIPFAHYQSSKTTVSGSTTSKVEVLNLGLLYDRFQILGSEPPLYNLELGLRPTATIDIEQESQSVGVKAYLAPGLALGNFILRQDNDIFQSSGSGGWLIVYPDIRFLGEASYVLDDGTNPEIEGDDLFAAIGIEPRLELALATGTPLDRLRLTALYRVMKVFAADIDATERYELGLEYAFDEDRNVNVAVELVHGENPDTFQLEDYWGVRFGVKF